MYCFIPFYTSRANNKGFSKNKNENKEMRPQNSIFDDKWFIASFWLTGLALLGFYFMTEPSPKTVIKNNNVDAPIYRQGSGVR